MAVTRISKGYTDNRTGCTDVVLLALAVQGLQCRVERMSFAYKEKVMAPLVPSILVVREIRIPRSHRIQKTLLVNKGEKDNALPGHALAIHIDLEGGRVEVNDRRRIFCHEIVEGCRDVSSTADGISDLARVAQGA